MFYVHHVNLSGICLWLGLMTSFLGPNIVLIPQILDLLVIITCEVPFTTKSKARNALFNKVCLMPEELIKMQGLSRNAVISFEET